MLERKHHECFAGRHVLFMFCSVLVLFFLFLYLSVQPRIRFLAMQFKFRNGKERRFYGPCLLWYEDY